MTKKKTDKHRLRLVQMLRDDSRYPWEAYIFVREALFYAQEVLEMGAAPDEESPVSDDDSKPGQAAHASADFAASEFEPDDSSDESPESPRPPERHLTGQQLCLAIRGYALEQYGYLAKAVLANWGLRSTGDFGEIVFNLIRVGEMKKSPTDRREDFDDVYSFDDAFLRGFEMTRVQG